MVCSPAIFAPTPLVSTLVPSSRIDIVAAKPDGADCLTAPSPSTVAGLTL
jgi:hypothetical protein